MRQIAIATILMLATAGTFSNLSVAAAGPDVGAAAFQEGRTSLAQGDFTRALASFEAAAKAVPDNSEYRQEFALVRQVVALRKSVATESDPERWGMTATALRAFYYDRGLYKEALPLDVERHRRLNSAESAALLGETQLEIGENAAAVATLGAVALKAHTPSGQWLLAIAHARTGAQAKAREMLAEIPAAPDGSAGLLFLAARVHALLGDGAEARDLLTRSLRSTPPSTLARAKDLAKACPDFRTLAEDPQFASVLATSSMVTESSCSQSKSCGGCPRASSCSSGSSGGTGGSSSSGKLIKTD
jgi:tetratricopeptide (TPR) repeat protein